MDDSPVDIRQPEVASAVAVGQTLMIETEQVQDRCVQVMNMNLVFDGAKTVLV